MTVAHEARRFEMTKPPLVRFQRTMRQLRSAILNNEVAFPSPTPQFHGQYRSDIQWRVAELFLIHGWTCPQLAARYGVSRGRIWLFVKSWMDRAIELGYLQDIPPVYNPSAEPNHVSAVAAKRDAGGCQNQCEKELQETEANAKTPADLERIVASYQSQVKDLQSKLQVVSCFVSCK
jgi:hypothetical protein